MNFHLKNLITFYYVTALHFIFWHLKKNSRNSEYCTKKIIFLNNFNTHHSLWDKKETASELQLKHLFNIIIVKNLHLFTFCEILIWRRKHQQNIINLTFITKRIKQNKEFCESENEWITVQNYILVNILINMWS